MCATSVAIKFWMIFLVCQTDSDLPCLLLKSFLSSHPVNIIKLLLAVCHIPDHMLITSYKVSCKDSVLDLNISSNCIP